MDKLEIEGRGFHTNLYAFRGVYSGGKEGKSRIQWLRSMVGSPDLISIPGMLNCSIDFGFLDLFIELRVAQLNISKMIRLAEPSGSN